MDEYALVEAVRSMGVEISGTQAWELLFHLDAVLRANQTVNLTRIDDRDEAAIRHILDSIAGAPIIAEAPSGPLVDLGSGAGYPGIPIAVVSGRPTTLAESKSRKAAFLSAVATALDAEIEVCPTRAEELALARPDHFAVASARAVGELPVLVELAAPLLRMGGRLVAYKGNPGAAEVRRGEAAAALVGLALVGRTEFVVPGLDAARCALVYERVAESSVRLPRRSGLARKRPLA